MSWIRCWQFGLMPRARIRVRFWHSSKLRSGASIQAWSFLYLFFCESHSPERTDRRESFIDGRSHDACLDVVCFVFLLRRVGPLPRPRFCWRENLESQIAPRRRCVLVRWCGGWDWNPRRPSSQGPKPRAGYDHAFCPLDLALVPPHSRMLRLQCKTVGE